MSTIGAYSLLQYCVGGLVVDWQTMNPSTTTNGTCCQSSQACAFEENDSHRVAHLSALLDSYLCVPRFH